MLKRYIIVTKKEGDYMKEEIYLKRKIYDKLLDWKNNSNGKTALLIEGARRIGKSTIAEEFAKMNMKIIY